MSGLKLKVLPQFPAKVLGGDAIAVTKQGGVFTIDLDFTELPVLAAPPPGEQYVLLYDATAQTFALVPLSSL